LVNEVITLYKFWNQYAYVVFVSIPANGGAMQHMM